MHYFTADLHLEHKRILTFEPFRPGAGPEPDIEEHDRYIKSRLRPEARDNNVCNELWLLGDVAGTRDGVARLVDEIRPHWHKIHLIRGNHDDRAAWRMRHLFDSANEALYVRVDKKLWLYLSHYAHRVWRNSNHGSIHIHGHSHGGLPPWGKSVDCGTMLHDFRPVSLRRIIEITEDRSNTYHH